jgi:hypothetical protein
LPRRRRDPYNLRDQGGDSWDTRAAGAAALLREVAAGSLPGIIRVADVGCGNQRLRVALEAEFGTARIAYQGFDIQPQTVDVIPLDVRKTAPPGAWDLVATLGVLEYIEDAGAVLASLGAIAPWYVVSHVVSDGGQGREADRQRHGWARLPSVTEQSDELVRAGFSVAGQRLVDGGRTCLWVCRSGRSAPQDV